MRLFPFSVHFWLKKYTHICIWSERVKKRCPQHKESYFSIKNLEWMSLCAFVWANRIRVPRVLALRCWKTPQERDIDNEGRHWTWKRVFYFHLAALTRSLVDLTKMNQSFHLEYWTVFFDLIRLIFFAFCRRLLLTSNSLNGNSNSAISEVKGSRPVTRLIELAPGWRWNVEDFRCVFT